jgi:Kef-type K+ transport system membrane component KefB
LLHYPLSKIRQPRVIAEIIGGILLGPSVFGRIPGFTNAIFPKDSMPTLSLAANIGLVLFLFLVGLEVDLRIMGSSWKIALSVGAAGMALPFGLGCAIAYGLYHQFRLDSGLQPISFGTYMLFVGVAMAITAFPVLCRILTELKLLQSQVGVIVLAAGVGNDVTGWVLLALCVALVNAGSGLTALYVLLVAVGYVLFLVYAIRPSFLWILRRTGSIQNGPTQSVVALTVLMTLASAFFTGIIGIHPIFGAFLIGLICPHDGGFAIKLTEKIEDLVTVFFLPLYFALSGLSTNIGLLNSGITWAYVIGVISVAFAGKVIGGTIAARLCKLVWRESLTVGVLMSCKGLVELIVLNIGLQAKILSQRTFTIFVVMALVTTFATTPLTSALYPPWYQKKLAAWKRGEIDWDGKRLVSEELQEDDPEEKRELADIQRLLVYLRLDSIPSLFNFLSLLSGEQAGGITEKCHPRKQDTIEETPLLPKPLKAHGLRMFELTDRLSSVMKDSEVEDYSAKDPVVNTFRTFGQLNNMSVSGEVQIVTEDDYAKTLNSSAISRGSDLVLLPWSETGAIGEAAHSDFLDTTSESFSNASQNHFVRQFLAHAPCHAAMLVDRHFRDQEHPRTLRRADTDYSVRSDQHHATIPFINRAHHIFFPFVGGPDDHFALTFILRLARNPNVTATILYVQSPVANDGISSAALPSESHGTKDGINVVTSPVTQAINDQEQAFFVSMRDSLVEDLKDRVYFDVNDSIRCPDVPEYARTEFTQSANKASNICIVGRNHGRGPFDIDANAMPEIRLTLGGFAAGLIGKIDASVLVVQAGGKGLVE